MEKYKIIYKKRFQKKFLQLIEYLSREWSLKVTDDFIATFQTKINQLNSNPNIGKVSTVLNVRTLLITKHNRLYYRVKQNTIEVINRYYTRANYKNSPYKKQQI